MLSKKTKRGKSKKEPCFFLEKLFIILTRKENYNLIHWSKDGNSINIMDPSNFSNKILPKYFKHNNYSSFKRQLNLYGFYKIRNIKNLKNEQFINENFTREKTLEEIKVMKKTNIIYDCINENQLDEKEIEEEINVLEEFIKKTLKKV